MIELSRAECELPEAGFVFCCFNNGYKITPAFFDIWMRLLAALPDSVLWLLDANLWAKANLSREAAARGVMPERLIFAHACPSQSILPATAVQTSSLTRFLTMPIRRPVTHCGRGCHC